MGSGCLSITLMKRVQSLNTQPFASQVATSHLSILRGGESRPEGVTEAKRSDEELRQTGGSSRRSSQRHIWSLSYVRQVPRRRIKTLRASLLFNYSITQMETVITWKWCASAAAPSVIFFFSFFFFFPVALRRLRSLELIDGRCESCWDAHVRGCDVYTVEMQASFSHMSRRRQTAACGGEKKIVKAGSSTSGARVMCCHCPQRGAGVSLPL